MILKKMRLSRDYWSGGRALVVAVLLSPLVGACRGQETAEITFVVNTADSLAADAEVFVAGSVDTLGTWHPRGLALHRLDATIWRGTAAIPADSSIEFKITQGTWQKEALAADGSVPQNSLLRVTRDTTVRIEVKSWKQDRQLQVTGTVRVHRDLSAAGLAPRDISVWLPPGYEGNDTKGYPVLYGMDGQNLFDPNTSTFGIDWQLDENADSLIAAGLLREVIIVGIDNTADRSREYHDTPLGATYRSFVVDVVKPLIDETYRTLPDPDNTAVIGS
ncbi:MAG: histidine kinase, partial [Rhodothermia bacterium]|nr:histidine kinase [Rhodothermia bacterium]